MGLESAQGHSAYVAARGRSTALQVREQRGLHRTRCRELRMRTLGVLLWAVSGVSDMFVPCASCQCVVWGYCEAHGRACVMASFRV